MPNLKGEGREGRERERGERGKRGERERFMRFITEVLGHQLIYPLPEIPVISDGKFTLHQTISLDFQRNMIVLFPGFFTSIYLE